MTLKIGVIGAGSIARHRHLPEIEMNPDAKLSVICDIVPVRAKEMAEKYDCKACTDYHQVVQDPQIDAVVVAATNVTHAEMSIAALSHGKHVLCEKPMATSLPDAKKMIDAANASGKQLMIAHNQRLEPAHQKAKQILESGCLGKVLSFTSVFGHQGCEHWAIDGADTWFFKKDQAGLGVLGDLAVHKMDLIRFLLDDNYVQAFSFLDTLAKQYPEGGAIDLEDNASCILRTEKGAVGNIIASWTFNKEDNSTIIYAEKGVMKIHTDPEFSLSIYYDHQTSEHHKLAKQSTNLEQVKSGIIDGFVNAVISDREVPIPGIEGYKALEAVIACQQACETGSMISIFKDDVDFEVS